MTEGQGNFRSINRAKLIRSWILLGTLLISGTFFPDSAMASVIKEGSAHFQTIGSAASFPYSPPSYSDADHPNSFFYDVFYYIPESLKNQSKVRALVFLHGGGPSTYTRDAAITMLRDHYLRDVMNVADQLGVIAVLPSSNGLNWNGHTVSFLRDLVAIMRNELDVDANRIGLAGHSMGGMGITRNYTLLADQFSFFMPMSAGMELSGLNEVEKEAQLNKVFNVAYIHIQGLNDLFQEFVTRCRDQLERTKALELKYGLSSKLKMLFLSSDHSPQYEALKIYANKAFRESPRNLYQKELWGSLRTTDVWAQDGKITYHLASVPRYFWIEALHFDLSKTETFQFHAKIVGNTIKIELPQKPTQTKTLRVYLSAAMLDFSHPIDVFINRAKAATRPASNKSHLQNFDSSDEQFRFDDFIDVVL